MNRPIRSTLLTTLLCLAALSTASLPGHAAEAVKDACKQDAHTLCKGIQPGGGRIAACLKEHKDEVSAECKEAIKAHHGEHRRRPGKAGSDAS
jgi:hypothetical protein